VANGGDQTKAALTIWPHLKQNSAEVKASKLMHDPHILSRIKQISDRIQAIVKQREAEQAVIQAQLWENRQIDVIRGLMRAAYTPITEVCQWDDNGIRVKPSNEISPDAAMSIHKIKMKHVRVSASENNPEINTITTEIAQLDKLKALELLGQNRGMFTYDTPTEKPYAVLIPTRRAPGQPLLSKEEKRNAKDAA